MTTATMQAVKRAVLIYNPRAGRWHASRRVEAISAVLATAGYRTVPRPTEAPGHATALAKEAAADGVDTVFTLGGDGTLREAAAGILGSTISLAPIPGGTVNVVAIALGIPQDPLLAARAMAGAEAVEMDVGLCGDEPFLMQTSAGLDARVMAHLPGALKRRFGRAAVGLSGLRQFLTYDFPTIELLADGSPQTATLVAACNLPHYAGAWRMAPAASFVDGVLDLVLFRGTGRLQTLSFARDLVFARHTGRRDVEVLRVQEVEIRGPQHLSLQLDGDALAFCLPVTIRLAAQKIRMLRPRSDFRHAQSAG